MVEGMREVYIQAVEEAEEEKEKSDEGCGHVGAELAHPAYLFVIYVISDEGDTEQESHDVQGAEFTVGDDVIRDVGCNNQRTHKHV